MNSYLLDKLKFELEKRNGFDTKNLVIARTKYEYQGETFISDKHIYRRCINKDHSIYFEKIVKSNFDKTIFALLPSRVTVVDLEFFEEVFPRLTKVSLEELIKLDKSLKIIKEKTLSL